MNITIIDELTFPGIVTTEEKSGDWVRQDRRADPRRRGVPLESSEIIAAIWIFQV